MPGTRPDDVIRMLDRFEVDHANPSWPANRWLTAMLRLFRPQIEALILARDAALADWARTHPGKDVFEDRELEITSQARDFRGGTDRRRRGGLERSLT
jgi:hypothetical protein